MLPSLAQALTALPFPDSIPERLAQEFAGLPARRRRAAVRKLLQRELAMWLNGQARWRREQAPPETRRVLWVCTWTTIGDAIMDLAPRTLLPPEVRVELLAPPSLAPLFERDARFAAVHQRAEDCVGPYDFVLLQHVTTEAIRLKHRHFRAVPWASMMGHRTGEMLARVDYADRRLRQLFGLPPGPVAPPTLVIEPMPELAGAARTHIAVALGARDERRRFEAWPATLEQVLQAWPAHLMPPLFHLLGAANARSDLSQFSAAWLATHAANHVEQWPLLDTARCIAACDAFLGTDSGLMHIAVALRRPGAALFSAVPPRYRLLPDGPVAGVTEASPLALAQALVDRVRGAGLAPHAGDTLDRHA